MFLVPLGPLSTTRTKVALTITLLSHFYGVYKVLIQLLLVYVDNSDISKLYCYRTARAGTNFQPATAVLSVYILVLSKSNPLSLNV